MHRLPLLAAVVTAASLSGAASASAAMTTYQATLKADYTYSYAKHEQSASGSQHHYSRDEEGKYFGRVTSVNPFVQFEDGKPLPYRSGNFASDANTTGGRSIAIKDDWSGNKQITCTSDGGKHYVQGRSAFGPAWGGRLGVRLFDELEIPEVCSNNETNGAVGLHNEGGELDDPTEWVGPFDTPAFLPERTGVIVADRYDAAIVREAHSQPLPAHVRKRCTLAFARRAARRLIASLDPDADGLAF